jgi:hypothetical protein
LNEASSPAAPSLVLQQLAKISFPELLNYTVPKVEDLRICVGVVRFLVNGSLHHDKLGGGIDQYHLTLDTDQSESSLFAWQYPDLISVPEIRRRRCEVVIGLSHCGRIQDPLPRYQLALPPTAVVREEPTQARIVPQGSIKAAIGDLLPGVVDGGPGFRVPAAWGPIVA